MAHRRGSRRLLAALAVVLLLGLGLRLFMGRAAEDRLQPGEDVAIGELRDPLPANAFLACPPGYCAATAEPTPAFTQSPERLAELWKQMVAGQAGVVIVVDDAARRRVVAIQHTPLLRFPDIVTAEFVALDAGRSGLAVYSRSRYGRGDFGTNRRRAVNWLKQIAGQ